MAKVTSSRPKSAADGEDYGDMVARERPCQHEPTTKRKALAEEKNHAPGEDRAGRNDDQSRSIAMPTVMKNRPTRMSRNGRKSSSTRCRKSLPPITMPAMNAPIGKARPRDRRNRRRPAPREGRSGGTGRSNGTWPRWQARTDKRPGNDGDGRERPPPARDAARGQGVEDPCLDQLSTATRRGIVAISWNNRMPMAKRPC